jgi:Protein of unknown function (DUF3485)
MNQLNMHISKYMPHLTVIALMITASICIAYFGDIIPSDKANDARQLPARIDVYEGADVLYCQNESCLKSYLASSLEEKTVCPLCQGRLELASLGELSSLPPDTTLIRKLYSSPDGDRILVSIVISSNDRTSIHRPQNCLPAQGYSTVKHRLVSVAIPDKQDIEINILDLHKQSANGNKADNEQFSAFAYFYSGEGRITPHYLSMIFWTSYNRLFHGSASKWAYISIATERQNNSDKHVDRIVNFAACLVKAAEIYPNGTGSRAPVQTANEKGKP